ncbi:hypothetical protein C823_007924 [Eubacterium plexicaudatum ASF492]|nr:hypothetical protein C823_007924 [Eubacterium plexicaudatum ASF492]
MNGEHQENGYVNLSAFRFADYPEWIYDRDGVEITKKIAMRQGENLVAVFYEIDNQSARELTLSITPQFQLTPKGSCPKRSQTLTSQRGVLNRMG